ncbi:hypothetical protein [Leadbetterella byssophila]|uniref:hypothetical protein n=1 Tax=Leadbetterella byssophila TaxID=316068 RepID=UPI0039A0873B
MEQIVIVNPDTSTIDLFSKSEVRGVTKAEQNCILLGDDIVSITVESAAPISFKLGGKIDVYGKTYTLNQAPEPQKKGNYFIYELKFEGVQYELLDVTFMLPANTIGDSLTGDIEDFAELIISNVNRVYPGKWELGEFPENSEFKTLTFSDENCLAVLQRLCEEYGQEFEIEQDGTDRILHIRKAGQAFPHTFEYGSTGGLYELRRKNVDSQNLVTRLYVYGGSQNLPESYLISKGVAKLCLPTKAKTTSYIEDEDAIDIYGVKENTKTFADVYPNRIGTISALGVNELTFVDSSMNFDLNEKESDGVTTKWLIAGTSAKVSFKTGKLAGYDFELKSYDHAAKTFVIIPFTDEYKLTFPSPSSSAFKFSVGDQYIITDIRLPQAYIDDAEEKLQELAEEYYAQNSHPRVQYELVIDRNKLKSFAGAGTVTNVFHVGDYIPVKDADLGVDREIRITGFTRNLLEDYDYKVTLGDQVTRQIITRIIADQIDTGKVIELNNLNNPARARANWRTSQEALNMVFDPDGHYFTEKIRPQSIETLYLTVGAKSMQFAVQNTLIEPNFNGNVNLVKITGGQLIHYTIQESGARIWNLSSNEITLTSGNSQAYYIYVKAQRVGTGASILISTQQIQTEQDPAFYHFLLGMLSSVDPDLNIRLMNLLYGHTTINGREIKTGVIMSSGGGESYFDLDNNKFRAGNNDNYISWNEAGDGKLKIKGGIVQSPSGNSAPIGVFLGAYNPSTLYYHGDEVTDQGATYRYIYATPASGIPVTNTTYWAVVAAKGEKGEGDWTEMRYAKNTSFDDPPELVITDTNPEGWVLGVIPANENEFVWLTTALKDPNGELVTLWNPPVRVSGRNGQDGVSGASPVLVPRGDYNGSTTYYGNETRVEAVFYVDRWYRTKLTAGEFSGILPTNTSKWEEFGANFESVATQLLLADGANIGNWYMKDGKIVSTLGTSGGTKVIELDAQNNKIELKEIGDSDKRIIIDADNSKIEIKSKIEKYTEVSGTEPIIQTLKIDASTGEFEARTSDNDVSRITSQGMFANRAGQDALSGTTGVQLKGAVVGLGYGKMIKEAWTSGWAIAGVVGIANNSATPGVGQTKAPAYGGWFKDLFAYGLIGQIKEIGAADTIAEGDVVITLTGSSAYNVTLPVVTHEGHIKLIKNIGTGTKTLLPGSGQKMFDDSTENANYSIQDGSLIIALSKRLLVSGTSYMCWLISKLNV